MSRSGQSEVIGQQMETVVRAALEETIPLLLSMDLATMEQRVQQMSRRLWGHLIAAICASVELHGLWGAPAPPGAAPPPARAGEGLCGAVRLVVVCVLRTK